MRGRDLAGAVAEAQERIAQNVKLPVGYRIDWAGEFEGMQQAQKRLALIVPVALVLILVLLYSLFNSLRDSLMALLGIPFSVAGGILALYVSDLNFSISAAIGFISLFGVSVMSGILIISCYNSIIANGTGTRDAMFEAVEQQMRPIMMMALSACIGLFPAAISTGIGSQVQRPLATVVVGGMLIGPILLLVIVPALQTLILDWTTPRQPAASAGEQISPRSSSRWKHRRPQRRRGASRCMLRHGEPREHLSDDFGRRRRRRIGRKCEPGGARPRRRASPGLRTSLRGRSQSRKNRAGSRERS